MLRLAAGAWTAELLPELGGAIGALRYGDRDVLRPAVPGTDDPLATACFPLVPYANRIAHGRFRFGGASRRLPPDRGAHPHSMHGVGWRRAWRVAEGGPGRATLVLVHRGDAAWPWSFTATQQFAAEGDTFRLTLLLRNDGGTTAPAGLGLHPYFAAPSGTRLRFEAASMLLADETLLPTDPAPADRVAAWGDGALLAGLPLVDNAFPGWSGTACLTTPAQVTVTAEGAAALHVYAPPGAGFCCLEPVNHLPDALNREEFAMPVLRPRRTACLTMRIAPAAP